MGDPRKLKKNYEKPKMLWNSTRLETEQGLLHEYGLKNMKELWQAQADLRQIRRQARSFLVKGEEAETYAAPLMQRLNRTGIIQKSTGINDVLGLNVRNILDRRLQSLVYKKGLSITPKQARQIITHGFIKVNNAIVKSPGYMVTVDDEGRIEYAKPINIKAGILQTQAAPAAEEKPRRGNYNRKPRASDPKPESGEAVTSEN